MPGPSPAPAPPVLVVIPCLNEASHIESVVGDLLDDAGSLDLRIVVVDGGSTDGTQDIAAKLTVDERVRLLPNPRKVQSSAVNRAVEAYGDEAGYLIRIDAHSQYPANFLATLIDEAAGTGADSVVVSMRTAGTGRFQQAAAVAQNSPLGNGGSAHRTAGGAARGEPGAWVDHGHHALMRIAAFTAVGGYDETFTHNEDAELDVRLGQAGYRIWLTHRTWSVYFPRDSPKALLQQYINYGRGRAANTLKHGTMPKVRQLLPLMVAPALAGAALLRIIRIPVASRLAPIPATAWALGCLGYGTALAVREKNPLAALSGPAAMIMHLGWSIGFWTGLATRAPTNPAAQAAQTAQAAQGAQGPQTPTDRPFRWLRSNSVNRRSSPDGSAAGWRDRRRDRRTGGGPADR